MEYQKLSVPGLIDKCADKDPLAWAEFVKRFSPLITLSIKKAFFKYSMPRNFSEEEIKDIRQNILVSLWGGNKLTSIKQRETINFWLAIIARNSVINYLKSNRQETLIYDEKFFEKLPSKASSENAPETRDLDDKIKELFEFLSPREKIMFKLYFEKELKLKDISNMLKIPIGTVSSVITRMRKKIK